MYELKSGTTLCSGKYKIIEKLGQGTFGITYLASMRNQGEVAIKEFFMKETNTRDNTSVTGSQNELFRKYKEKFKTEARNLAKMSEYGDIVKIYEVFEDNNTAYFAMEYIEGKNLDDYIKECGHLSEEQSIEYIKAVSTALKHLHDNKMLHLDLKPKNIMRRVGSKLYLIDFGLSKQYDENGEAESSSTIGLGTPGYAPLEQSNFKGEFAPTLDIYALGATFYKMLTGETAPEATDLFNNGFSIMKQKMQNNGVSTLTINIVEKAMSLKKGERYQSVEEFFNALDNTTPIPSPKPKPSPFISFFQVLVMSLFAFWIGCGVHLIGVKFENIIIGLETGYLACFVGMMSILFILKNYKAQIVFSLIVITFSILIGLNFHFFDWWLVPFSGICFFIYGLLEKIQDSSYNECKNTTKNNSNNGIGKKEYRVKSVTVVVTMFLLSAIPLVLFIGDDGELMVDEFGPWCISSLWFLIPSSIVLYKLMKKRMHDLGISNRKELWQLKKISKRIDPLWSLDSLSQLDDNTIYQ